jgi:hypothetical protein
MKLTLDIDNNLVADIEKYADLRGQDISTIVENYFYTIVGTSFSNKAADIRVPLQREAATSATPIVDALKGSCKIPADFDYKQVLSEALEEKYML